MAGDGGLKGKKNNSRRFTGGGPRPDLNNLNRMEALERQAAWAALTPKEQLALLDSRLGVCLGAVKQRAKIQSKINGSNKHTQVAAQPSVQELEEVSEPQERMRAKDRRAAEKAKIKRMRD